MSRTTLNAVEAGEGFQRSTLTKIENALTRLEEEAGIGAPPPPADKADEELMTVELELPDGRIARVKTKGSHASAQQIAEQVTAILHRLSQDEG